LNAGLPDNMVFFGRVLRPHGLEGLLRVQSFSQSAASLLNAGKVFFKLTTGENHHLSVISARPHKNVFLAELAGLTDITQAESFRGAEIYISKDALVREEGEYFWFELLGLDVFSSDNEFLGVVSQIIPAGNNEIYVVKNGDREILLPAAHDVVNHIDLENGKMIISALEGLLDLNEV
jgi:16S rRNA processing protein RimM